MTAPAQPTKGQSDSILYVDGHSVRRGKGSIYAVADQPCVAEEIAAAVNAHAELVAFVEDVEATLSTMTLGQFALGADKELQERSRALLAKVRS